MASNINISFKGLEAFQRTIQEAPAKLTQRIGTVLSANAEEIATRAKDNVAVDVGALRASISADNSKPLEKTIAANVFYAAFVEFGTGKYAAAYVGTLPPDWRTYAATFKGKKGGESFDKFLERIIEWVKRKGLAGTYSVKTKKRTGKKGARLFEDAEVAYPIALAILRNGIRPQPYQFPAYRDQRGKIISDIETLLKGML